MATHPYQVPHSRSYNSADVGLAATTATASRRKSASIIRRQQRAVSMLICQQQLHLLQLWRLLAEGNATRAALAAFG